MPQMHCLAGRRECTSSPYAVYSIFCRTPLMHCIVWPAHRVCAVQSDVSINDFWNKFSFSACLIFNSILLSFYLPSDQIHIVQFKFKCKSRKELEASERTFSSCIVKSLKGYAQCGSTLATRTVYPWHANRDEGPLEPKQGITPTILSSSYST